MIAKKVVHKVVRLLFSFLIIVSSVLPTLEVKALGVDQTENVDIVRSVALSYKLKGGASYIDLVDPYLISDITLVDKLHAKYQFELIDHVDGITGEPNRTMHSGDYYVIDLPEKVQILSPADGVILGNDNRPLANFSFVQNPDLSWQIRIEFTTYIDDLNEYDIHGMMEFDFILDLSAVGEGTTTTIIIPIDNDNSVEIDVTKPVPAPTTPISLTKTVTSYTALSREIVWNIRIMPEIGKFSGTTFTDTLDITKVDLKSLKHGSVTLVMGTDYTYDALTGKITYLIPSGRDGSSFQNIIVTGVVKRSVYGTLTPTNLTNQAQLTGGDSYVDLTSNTVSQTITPNWFTKTGSIFEGNKIKWSFDVNTNTQSMFNGVITDVLGTELSLDTTSVKLGSTSITVYSDSHTPASDSEVYGVLSLNGDGSSTLNVFLARTKALASSTKQTLTFVTTVTAPSSIEATDPIYSNTATFNADLVLDDESEMSLPEISSGPIPVSIPHVNIIKSHQTWSADEKRNGIITWTIAVSSHLANYGTSSIVDTLPADQDFLVDEIYLGSLKLDGSTNPSAVISSDGRTLTIAFSTNNAWSTQQNLTIKTKIKQENYGLNVNRDFTNSAKATLFSELTGLELDSMTDGDNIRIRNDLITKSSSVYSGNTTQQGQNPRINFSIVLNNNLLPMQDVLISDDLTRIITEFKKSTESSFAVISGLKWTYVANSMKIVKNAGTLDDLDLNAIISTTQVVNDVLSVDFGSGIAVNDKYTLTFTLELDVASNDIFQLNGVLRVRGNVAGVSAIGLKTGTNLSSATGNSAEIKNEVLGKSGLHSVAEQQAIWNINLNQHRVGLINTSVVDVLPLGLTLDPTSIKLYSNVIGTDGNFVTGNTVVTQGIEVPFTYTYLPTSGIGNEGRFTLTVILPDNQSSYVLRFATDVSPSLLGTQVTNAAYFVGENSLPENTNNSNLTFSSSAGGGSTTKASVTVRKLDKDDGSLIDGAIFALHWLRDGDPADPVFVRSLGTTNGSVIFRGLTRGELYTITEISAPSGYLLDDSTPVGVIPPSTGVADADVVTIADTPIKQGTWVPTAIKHLEGRPITELFRFEMTQGGTAIMNGTASVERSDGDYNVVFDFVDGVNPSGKTSFQDDYIFNESDPIGTRHLVSEQSFIVKEIDDDLPGYTYDTKEVVLTLEVFNEKGKPELVMILKDTLGNTISDESAQFLEGSTPIFNNTYSANGSLVMKAYKTLTGRAIKNAQFSFLFQAYDPINDEAIGEATLLTNNDLGEIVLPEIKYTTEDDGKTFYYQMSEVDGKQLGYTYDPARYLITVTVTDKGDGKLDLDYGILKTVEGASESVLSVIFTNTYDKSLVPDLPNTGQSETPSDLGFIFLITGSIMYFVSRRKKAHTSS